MPGRRAAVLAGSELEGEVRRLAESIGLSTRSQVHVGRRLWGAERRIDVVITDTSTRRTLGVECKYQRTQGTAEEKIYSTIDDIRAWPIDGIVVIDGPGFSSNARHFLYSTGKAVDLDDLENWLRLFFGIPEAVP